MNPHNPKFHPPEDRQCIVIAKNGERCKAWAVKESTECFRHNKDVQLRARAKAGQVRGGIQRGVSHALKEWKSLTDGGQPFKFRTIDDVVYALAAVFNAVATGELDTKTASCEGYLANIMLNAMRDQQALRSEYVAKQDFKRILETTLQAVKDNLTDLEARKRVQAVFNQALLEGVDPREIAVVQHTLPKAVQPTIMKTVEMGSETASGIDETDVSRETERRVDSTDSAIVTDLGLADTVESNDVGTTVTESPDGITAKGHVTDALCPSPNPLGPPIVGWVRKPVE